MKNYMLLLSVLSAALISCDGKPSHHSTAVLASTTQQQAPEPEEADPAEVVVGEKLFHEIRFSQYFFAHSQGQLNQPTPHGDPVVETLESLTQTYDNPYRGQAISCAACHFVDQVKDVPGLGMRVYADFARRSRVPDRQDGQMHAVRNSPNMVAMALEDGMFLHADGEFANPVDLSHAALTGRNMGWKADEQALAIRHIADVIRQDAGEFPTDVDLVGFKYADILAGGTELPAEYQLPPEYRIHVRLASDEAILQAVSRLVGAYLQSLDFARDEDGHYNGSPYDLFLRKNGLPLAPAPGETAQAYSKRLEGMVHALKQPHFVSTQDREFQLHEQDFEFAEKELRGFQIFFGAGKCTQCHAAPDFTDHLFHNTGVSQEEYDNVHRPGEFMKLPVPSLPARNAQPDVYLPQSAQFPNSLALFRSIPTLDDRQRADLGVWSVFANPFMPQPQSRLQTALCNSLQLDCRTISPTELLDLSLGMFKTPTVRDLGHSAPYLHNGSADTIQDVIRQYMRTSALTRAQRLRNPDPHLGDVVIRPADIDALAAFLKSLNEDYE